MRPGSDRHPIHVVGNLGGNWSWLPLATKAHEFHHYYRGSIATQYCTFEKKGGDKTWMAKHRDEDHETLSKLCVATDYFIDDHYHSLTSESKFLQLVVFYPVLVIQGELLAVEERSRRLSVKCARHLRYHRSVVEGRDVKDYVIDVVTEDYFIKFLRRVEAEMDEIASRMFHHQDEIRQSLSRWLDNYRSQSINKSSDV